MQDAPTRLQGQSLTIGSGKLLRLAGGDPPRHRKYIRITNEDTGSGSTTAYLVAGDEQSIDPTVNSVVIARLAPGEFLELFTNATLYLKNITSENLTPVHVLELFYV